MYIIKKDFIKELVRYKLIKLFFINFKLKYFVLEHVTMQSDRSDKRKQRFSKVINS